MGDAPSVSRGVVALDVDGVLNSERFFAGRTVAMRGDPLSLMVQRLDPVAIEHLNAVVDAANPMFVLSSDWRNEARWPRCSPAFVAWQSTAQALARRGFRGQLVGRTPLPSEVRPEVFARFRGRHPGPLEPVSRGYEIQQWLDEHPVAGPVAIIDDVPNDAFSMEHLAPLLVQTDPRTGFTRLDAARVIALLGSGAIGTQHASRPQGLKNTARVSRMGRAFARRPGSGDWARARMGGPKHASSAS